MDEAFFNQSLRKSFDLVVRVNDASDHARLERELLAKQCLAGCKFFFIHGPQRKSSDRQRKNDNCGEQKNFNEQWAGFTRVSG